MFDNDDQRREVQGATGPRRDGPGATAASGRSGLSPVTIGIVVLVAVCVVFILQNREKTTIDFLVFELRSRVWTAIVFSMILGALLDRLVMRWWRRRRRHAESTRR
jgi:uncharacterized integral membrane protein